MNEALINQLHEDTRPTPIIYLAGAIKNVEYEAGIVWRGAVASQLKEQSIVTFNPAVAWLGQRATTAGPHGGDLIRRIQAVDDAAVLHCDGMVVCYQGVESVGTDHEIQLALDLNKPMWIYKQSQKRFTEWLQERFTEEWLLARLHHGRFIFVEVQSMVAHISRFFPVQV